MIKETNMQTNTWRAVIVWSLCAATAMGAAPAAYKAGEKVKDFALEDTAGKTVALSQFKGKVIVLAFSAAF